MPSLSSIRLYFFSSAPTADSLHESPEEKRPLLKKIEDTKKVKVIVQPVPENIFELHDTLDAMSKFFGTKELVCFSAVSKTTRKAVKRETGRRIQAYGFLRNSASNTISMPRDFLNNLSLEYVLSEIIEAHDYQETLAAYQENQSRSLTLSWCSIVASIFGGFTVTVVPRVAEPIFYPPPAWGHEFEHPPLINHIVGIGLLFTMAPLWELSIKVVAQWCSKPPTPPLTAQSKLEAQLTDPKISDLERLYRIDNIVFSTDEV